VYTYVSVTTNKEGFVAYCANKFQVKISIISVLGANTKKRSNQPRQ
jgi:hypothetical protein